MTESKSASSGIGFGGLLTVLFIGLKLGGVIAWSWWWVLSPLWISLLLTIAVIIIVIAFIGLSEGVKSSNLNKTRKLNRQEPKDDWSWPGKRRR